MGAKAQVTAGTPSRVPPEADRTRPIGFFSSFMAEARARAAAEGAIARDPKARTTPIATPATSSATMAAAVSAGDRARKAAGASTALGK